MSTVTISSLSFTQTSVTWSPQTHRVHSCLRVFKLFPPTKMTFPELIQNKLWIRYSSGFLSTYSKHLNKWLLFLMIFTYLKLGNPNKTVSFWGQESHLLLHIPRSTKPHVLLPNGWMNGHSARKRGMFKDRWDLVCLQGSLKTNKIDKPCSQRH